MGRHRWHWNLTRCSPVGHNVVQRYCKSHLGACSSAASDNLQWRVKARFKCQRKSTEAWGKRKTPVLAKAKERGVGQSFPGQWEILVHPHLHALLILHEEKQHLPFFRRKAGHINDNGQVTVAGHLTALHFIATQLGSREKWVQWSRTLMLKQQKIIKEKAAKGLLKHTAETICAWEKLSFHTWPTFDRTTPGRMWKKPKQK